MLAAYDAMRGAGMDIETVAAKPAPADRTVAAIEALTVELRNVRSDYSEPARASSLKPSASAPGVS